MALNKRLHIWLFSLIMLASCSDVDDASTTEVTAKQICFTAGIDNMSMRSATNLLQSQFPISSRINLYINEVTGGNPSVIYNQPIEYVVTDREGSMIPIIESIPHYPTNGNNVAIRGFYPSTAISSDGTFTTKTNQVSSVGYQGSDLMYSSLIGRNTEGVLNLTFRHLNSKITYHLTSSDPNVILNGSRVSLLNVKPTAIVNIAQGTIGTAYGDNSEPIVISNDGSKDGSAVILPQPIQANTKFIEIVLYTGEIVYGVMPTTYTFQPGTSYIFNIDVKVDRVASVLNINSIEVTDWVDAFISPQDIEADRIE